MDIFGISSAKIILILLIAIILLGPDQVPTIVKTVGKTIRDFRRFVNETTKEFNDVTGDLRKEFTDSVGDLRSELQATQAELKGQFDFSDVMNPITSAIRDPLGTITTPAAPAADTSPAATFAAATAAINEANPMATQTVAYTPPQPLATFTPEPMPESPAPESLPAPEPIVVQTSYAESLAAAAAHGPATSTSNAPHLNGNGNGNGNGHTPFTGMRATKADPFADFALLAPASATAPEIVTITAPPAPPAPSDAPFVLAADAAPHTGLATIPVGEAAGQITQGGEMQPTAAVAVAELSPLEPASVTPAPTPITTRRASVGGSVGGTKYGRKRA